MPAKPARGPVHQFDNVRRHVKFDHAGDERPPQVMQRPRRNGRVALLARGREHRRLEAILHTPQPDTGVVPVVVKMKGLSGFAFTLAISSRTIESGTVCARPFFVLLPGMFQVAPSSLSSRRVMPAISFRLWPVSINTPRTALRS